MKITVLNWAKNKILPSASQVISINFSVRKGNGNKMLSSRNNKAIISLENVALP